VDASRHHRNAEKEGNIMISVDTTSAVALLVLVVLPALAAVVVTGIAVGRTYADNLDARFARSQRTPPPSPLTTSWAIRYGHHARY